MAKIRVGQLAKELNLKVGEVLARLRDLGAEVKSNLSTVDEEMAVRLRSAASSPEKRPAEALKAASPAGSPAAGGLPPRPTQRVRRPRPPTTAPAKPGVLSTPQRPQVATGPPRPGIIRGAVSPPSRPVSPALPTTRPTGSPGPTGFKPASLTGRPLSGAGQAQRPLPPRGASAHSPATSAGRNAAAPARPE